MAMTMPILVGTDGTRRMGKSLGNYIGVAEAAENQFGKIMSIPDEPMRQYFTLLTELPLAEVDQLLAPGVNPRDAKEALGKAIVAQYHGARSRGKGRRRVPPPRLRARSGRHPCGGTRRRQARRRRPDPRLRLAQRARTGIQHVECPPRDRAGGVNIGPDREGITDPKALVHVHDGLIVRVGKRKIVRVQSE